MRSRRGSIAGLLLALVLAAAPGCTSAPPVPALAGSASVETRLFFGTKIGLTAEVSDAEWRDFLDGFVVPRFPDGLTVEEASGRYRMRDSGKIVAERTHVVIILHDGAARPDAAVREIIEEYKRRFRQESVLRVDAAAGASF